MRNERVIEKLRSAHQQMLGKLQEARVTSKNMGSRGSGIESAVRQFLRDYTRQDVGTGEIIDTVGNESTQTDVVIVDHNHPLTFAQDSPGLFFIEGVRVAGEVKACLRKSDLSGTTKEKGVLEKSSIFKHLQAKHPRPASKHPISNLYEEPGSYVIRRPYFLLAFETKIQLKGIYETIIEYQRQHSLGTWNILDAEFILDRGWVINSQSVTTNRTPSLESTESLWRYQESDMVLTDMLSWLSIVMPRDMKEGPFINWYTEAF